MMMSARVDRYLPNLSAALFLLLDGLAVYRTPGQRPPSGRRRVVLSQEPIYESQSFRANDVLVIQSKDWLSFEMTVPRVSVKEQKEVVALEVSDRTPFRPGETIFDWAGTPGGKCTVNIIRHDLINEARQSHSSEPTFPRWLVCSDGKSDQFIDLAPKAKNAFRLPMIAATAIAFFLIVFGGISLTETHRILTEAEALKESISLAEAQNEEYKTLRNNVDAFLNSKDATSRSAELLEGRLSIFRLLEELTRATPDHSFLLELDIEGTGISVTAVSEQPEDLLRSIEDSPTFESARILGAASAEDDKFSVQVGFDIKAKPE